MHDAALFVSKKQKWLRFIIGGFINTGFTYLAYVLMRPLLGYQWAYFLAYGAGIIFAYWFNSTIVFKVDLNWKKFFSYPLVYILQYALSGLLLSIFVQIVGISEIWAPILITIIMVPLTYVLSSKVLA